MARHDDDIRQDKAHRIGRRGLLKAAAGTAVALGATGAIGTAAGQARPGDTVVDLGDEGLTNGDRIDPYLEQHLASGTEVRIPRGAYRYTGAGLGGQYEDAALVGSPEGVVFQRPEDPETAVRPEIFATGGRVRIENVSVRGQRGQTQSHWRVGAAAGASVELVNVNHPDGSVADSESTGVYAGTDHAGTLWLKSCYFANFANVACDVSDPQKDAGGRVLLEDCDFVNTETGALRLGSDASVVRGCYFEATQPGPSGSAETAQRGIDIDEPGSNLLIEDCDFAWSGPGTAAVEFDEAGQGGDGVVRNLRLRTDGDGGLFDVQWDVGSAWSGENVQITEA